LRFVGVRAVTALPPVPKTTDASLSSKAGSVCIGSKEPTVREGAGSADIFILKPDHGEPRRDRK
jgi:hypothetical protein